MAEQIGTIITPVTVEFNLVTSESWSMSHMLERSGLPDALALTNNALAWYKIYRDTKSTSMHMIAKNPENGCHYFISDSVRAGDKVQRQNLMLSPLGLEKIKANFLEQSTPEQNVPALLSDSFYVPRPDYYGAKKRAGDQ